MESEQMENTFLRMEKGYPQQSFLFYGDDLKKSLKILKQVKNAAKTFPTETVWIKVSRNANFRDDMLSGLRKIGVNIVSFEETQNGDPLIGPIGLPEFFQNMGLQAKDSGLILCIYVENLHLIKKADAKELCSAIARSNRMSLPIVAFMSGLPSVIHLVGNASLDADMLFCYEEIL